jgi:hypothetical protein
MIERYTIKFSPAVRQKELEKVLHGPRLQNDAALSRLHKMKPRIEIICDFEDLKMLTEMMKSLGKKEVH